MGKRKDAEVILGGNTWTIKFVTRKDLPKNHYGDCDWDKRVIRVRRDLCLRSVLDTLIHECRHGQHEVMFEAESFIDRTSTELADALIKTGFIK
jgi:hypothetical protein